MKYVKKPVVIEAHQWFKNGDHPEDNSFGTDGSLCWEHEGKIVRYFRHPTVGDNDGQSLCKHCGVRFHDHGWVDTLEGGHKVCPGDFIITGIKGEKYPCKPDIFHDSYECVECNV